jgi:hypothetical protein
LDRLAEALGISPLVAQRWREIAELGTRRPPPRLADLDLLLRVGVDSVGRLRDQMDTRKAAFYQELTDEALDRGVVPPELSILRRWSRRRPSFWPA